MKTPAEHSREYRKRNPEKIKAYNQQYRAKNKERAKQKHQEMMKDETYREKRRKQSNRYDEQNRDRRKAYRESNKNTAKSRYRDIKGGAVARELEFELSFEEYEKGFFINSCRYCGEPGTTGIDRVDSSIGYTIYNCVPCCAICNRAKMDLSCDEFKTHIIKIYRFACEV